MIRNNPLEELTEPHVKLSAEGLNVCPSSMAGGSWNSDKVLAKAKCQAESTYTRQKENVRMFQTLV